jgi:hypothetical protein
VIDAEPGTYTIVDGEKIPMAPGDVLLDAGIGTGTATAMNRPRPDTGSIFSTRR